MEHCRNSTGLIFRCFAIFYGIFLEILPIFDVRFVRQPARPTFRTIISPTFARYTNRLFLSQHRVFCSFRVSQQLCSVSLQVVPLYQTINDFRQFYLYQRQKQCLSQGHIPINRFVAIFAHRPTASFASQNCCFFAWFCSLHSSLAHKSNQKEYSFPDHCVAKFATLYYIQYCSFCYTSEIKGDPASRASMSALWTFRLPGICL